MRAAHVLVASIAFATLLFAGGAATAGDTWTTPYDGVRHLHRTTSSPVWNIHALVVDLNVPGTEFAFAFNAAEVKTGQKSVTVTGVPAGKYQVSRGKSKGQVEVTAGKSVAVTLVRDEPVKK